MENGKVSREYDQIWSLVGTRQIEELVDLPLITNPDLLDVLDVFTEIVTPALHDLMRNTRFGSLGK